MREKLKIFSLLFLISCGNSETPALIYMPNMVDSPALKAQEEMMRIPPEGTLPQGFQPYLADSPLSNPLSPTAVTFEQGKKKYDTYCIVCHGPTGKGDGLIVPKFPMPPSLHSDKVRGWSDGRIFHAITMGQNLMPSYATQIQPKERWAIIYYVRALQRSVHPEPEDVEALKKAVEEGRYP